MDSKELKKLQEKLKKAHEALKKELELLAQGKGQLVSDQATLKDDVKKLEALQKILVEAQNALTKDQETLTIGQDALAEDQRAVDKEKERLGPLAVIEPGAKEEKFNSKWLEGAVFRGRKEGKPLEKPGKKTKVKTFVPFERPMTVADVLSFRITGNKVIFVTADGQKRTAKK